MTSTQTLALSWRLRDRDEAHAEDAALVRRARSGDQMAFREIVERHKTRVMSFVYRILRNPNDAEDVAQEVFASAFFALRNLELHGSLIAWLYRIAVNESFDWLRKKKARPLLYESDLSEDAVRAIHSESRAQGVGTECLLARREMLLALLDKLSTEDRTLLLLREVEGYSISEISAMTGLNGNTVKIRLFRIRRKLARAAQGVSSTAPREGGAT